MKFAIAFLTFLSATTVSAASVFDSSPQQPLDGEFKVPGKNPLTFCADPKDYQLAVDYVDLVPNPPVPGQELTIKANGTVLSEITEGAYVHLIVKYNGIITLINTNQDLCNNLPKIDIECPLEKGTLTVDKSVKIPAQVPKGLYNVHASIFLKDDSEALCMNGQVRF